eukprot:m.687109 g.687109  ORF g.687109 m.687109 type:complete len:416 (-) comp22840_c0_seq59:4821-6068(-)
MPWQLQVQDACALCGWQAVTAVPLHRGTGAAGPVDATHSANGCQQTPCTLQGNGSNDSPPCAVCDETRRGTAVLEQAVLPPPDDTYVGVPRGCALVIRPGTWRHCSGAASNTFASTRMDASLSAWADVATLHIGITDTTGTRVYNFDACGCTVNDAAATAWARCVSLPLLADADDGIVDYGERTGGTWWDMTLAAYHHHYARHAASFDAHAHNCFDYVVGFVNRIWRAPPPTASADSPWGDGPIADTHGHPSVARTWTKTALCAAGLSTAVDAVERYDRMVQQALEGRNAGMHHRTMLGACSTRWRAVPGRTDGDEGSPGCTDASAEWVVSQPIPVQHCDVCADYAHVPISQWMHTVTKHSCSPSEGPAEDPSAVTSLSGGTELSAFWRTARGQTTLGEDEARNTGPADDCGGWV